MTRRTPPRRAWDPITKQVFTPPTIGQCQAEGETTAAVSCLNIDCRHQAVIALDPFPDQTFFPDIVLKLRCSRCGSREIDAMKDMHAHYVEAKGMALPDYYRVVGRDVPWPDGKVRSATKR